ncbi:hypothetical protein R1flu_011530 [Riccia fluitans]|uniref:Germin-like protein n=1 Tax=Riccia fluitans TaxID=41844 RepID=A0ABD1Z8A8_9MARC
MASIGHATLLFCVLLFTVSGARASDPELTKEFSVPPGVDASQLNGNYFTYTGFRGGVSTAPGETGSKKATVTEFPALDGLGISFFLMSFAPGGVLPPHLHPRGSKLIYMIQGTLTVGFMDSNHKLYNSTLEEGDLYVVPRALVHYMANLDGDKVTKVIFAFSSSNPGSIRLPENLFGSNIPAKVLKKSFGVSGKVIEELEAPFYKNTTGDYH